MGTSRRRSIHHGDARSCRCCISQIPAGRHHAVSGRERRGHQEPVGRGGARDVKRDYRAFLRWGALSRVRSMVSSVSASGMGRHLGVMAAPSPSRSSHCSRSSHGPHQPPRPKPIHVHLLPQRLGSDAVPPVFCLAQRCFWRSFIMACAAAYAICAASPGLCPPAPPCAVSRRAA